MDGQVMDKDRNSDKLYSVTELANEFEITPRAIRFYESKGLLSPQRAGSTRVYTYRDRARLMIILRGKRMGFSLGHIKAYLELYDVDRSRTEQLKQLLFGVREKIEEIEAQKRDLDMTMDELKSVEKETLSAMEEAGISQD
ncbi:MAG: MerR family DNA-binding transcriptional regulator [Alphaproteobacteria bacterium]|nr:MerR family DNA-binding transcriptional regulator [Rhodospirillales bacterium]MCW9045833.1 MerR family DNA-binding transcriptional regulator [Alphaproteobacteria bacterium]